MNIQPKDENVLSGLQLIASKKPYQVAGEKTTQEQKIASTYQSSVDNVMAAATIVPNAGWLIPVVLITPSSNSSEVVIRTLASIALSQSSLKDSTIAQYAVGVGTEIITKLTPSRIKNHSSNQTIPNLIKKNISILKNYKETLENKTATTLDEMGLNQETIKSIQIFVPQLIIGLGYSLTNNEQSALSYSWNAGPFTESMGIIGKNVELVASESFASRASAIDTKTLQIITGVGLSAISYLSSPESKVTITLINAVLMTPHMSDKIIESNLFQSYISQPLEQIGKTQYQRAASAILNQKIIKKFISYFSSESNSTEKEIEKGKLKKILALAPSYSEASGRAVIEAACKVAKIYSHYQVNEMVSSYAGAEIGALSHLMHLEKDRFSLLVVTSGALTAFITQSPTQSSIAMEIVDEAIRTPKIQAATIKAAKVVGAIVVETKDFVEETVSSVKNRPYDKITFQADVIGAAVAYLGQDPTIIMPVSRDVEKFLRQEKIQKTTSALSGWFSQAKAYTSNAVDRLKKYVFSDEPPK